MNGVSEMDFVMAGVSVTRYRADLLAAVEAAPAVVQPAALVEPVVLWLRGAEERVRRNLSLLGAGSVGAWNAAQAILAEQRRLDGWTKAGEGS